MTGSASALNLIVIDSGCRNPGCRYVARFANRATRDVIRCFATGIDAVMTCATSACNIFMAKNRGCECRCLMTSFTRCVCCYVICRFTTCYETVVATFAAAKDVRVIDCKRRRPTSCVVAIFTNVRCCHVAGRFTCGEGAVMAAKTGAAYFTVIDHGR